MGKRPRVTIEDILNRPWCYYCERDFDDLKILISHQKAKHFKCERCGRRLNTIGGLSVHMNQVHKESLTTVENALDHRCDIGIEIFGMEGIPEDVMNAHQRLLTETHFRQEAKRRAETGNPPPGTAAGEAIAKKAKIETPEELKARLAEHRARKAAEKAAMSHGSGSSTPMQGVVPSGNNTSMSPEPQATTPHVGQTPLFNPYVAPEQHGYVQQHPGAPITQLPFSNSPPGFPQSGTPAFYPQGPPPYRGNHHQHNPTPNQQKGRWSPAQLSSPPVPGTSLVSNHGLPQPAPGLPQRPSFNPPNASKEDMAKMHAGQLPPQMPAVPHHQASGRSPAPPQPSAQSGSPYTGDAVDELIKSVTGEAQYAKPLPQDVQSGASVVLDQYTTPKPSSETGTVDASDAATMLSNNAIPAPTNGENNSEALPKRPTEHIAASPSMPGPAAKKAKKTKKAADVIKMVYSDEVVSPEEKLASKPKYAFARSSANTIETEFTRGEPGEVGGSGRVTGETASETVRDPQD